MDAFIVIIDHVTGLIDAFLVIFWTTIVLYDTKNVAAEETQSGRMSS